MTTLAFWRFAGAPLSVRDDAAMRVGLEGVIQPGGGVVASTVCQAKEVEPRRGRAGSNHATSKKRDFTPGVVAAFLQDFLNSALGGAVLD
jgi:hypothetical protein